MTQKSRQRVALKQKFTGSDSQDTNGHTNGIHRKSEGISGPGNFFKYVIVFVLGVTVTLLVIYAFGDGKLSGIRLAERTLEKQNERTPDILNDQTSNIYKDNEQISPLQNEESSSVQNDEQSRTEESVTKQGINSQYENKPEDQKEAQPNQNYQHVEQQKVILHRETQNADTKDKVDDEATLADSSQSSKNKATAKEQAKEPATKKKNNKEEQKTFTKTININPKDLKQKDKPKLPPEIENFKPTFLKSMQPKKIFADGRRLPPIELLPQKPNNSSVR